MPKKKTRDKDIDALIGRKASHDSDLAAIIGVKQKTNQNTEGKRVPHKGMQNLRPWKKGFCPNPGGRPKDTPEQKMWKKLSRQELLEVCQLVMMRNEDALLALMDDPEATVLQKMVARVAKKVFRNGDVPALKELLDRSVGKVKDELDMNMSGELNMPQVIVTMPSNGKERKSE